MDSYTYNGQAIESRIRTPPFSLILSDLAKYSMIRSATRSHLQHWLFYTVHSSRAVTVLTGTSRPTPTVSLTIAKQYIGAYTEPAHKNPDIGIWREKINRKSGFAKVEQICKHYIRSPCNETWTRSRVEIQSWVMDFDIRCSNL